MKKIAFVVALAMLAVALFPITSIAAMQTVGAPTFGSANIGHGIVLHYAEEGRGTPVIFVHGSLSDYRYWRDQVNAFSKHYRAIAYSRRYNFPNTNPARAGYSAVTDADDLARFIRTLHLGRVDIVGHSYGALTALFLAIRHPELIRNIVLAEAPAVSLLAHLPGDQAETGRSSFEDIQRRMVAPMRTAFRKGDRERGTATFIDYVFNNSKAWATMSHDSQEQTLSDAHEWDVMMTSGTLFPEISPAAIRKISAPVLIISGAKSYPFLALIDRELVRLLPNNRHLIVPNAGHQMWYQNPQMCRRAALAFFQRHPS